MRGRLRRGLLLLVLVGYAAIVVRAAWRHEIRPGWLDAPGAVARGLLAWAGIPPGVAVFTADSASAAEAKIVDLCLEVRVVEADGRVVRLHPDAGERCPAPQPRIWVKGEEIWLDRSAVSLRAAVAARRQELRRGQSARATRLLAEALAAHFRARAHAEGLAPERYALLWAESRVDTNTGERGERDVALMRWGPVGEGDLRVSWRPDASLLDAYWPALETP